MMGLLMGAWLGFVPAWPACGEESDQVPPQALHNYVNRPEPAFRWEKVGNRSLDQGTVHNLRLTSQQWQGIVWQHTLLVFEPPQLQQAKHVLLFVTGGRTGREPGDGDLATGLKLAHAVPGSESAPVR
jgi:PhoPQ-activated pathogenicity-related protein